MVGVACDHALDKIGAAIRRLRHIDIPDGAGVILARCRRGIVHQIDGPMQRRQPGEDRRRRGRDVDRHRRRPAQPMIGGGREEDRMGIRPGRVEVAIRGVHCQRREDVVQPYAARPREDQLGRPRLAHIRAARDKDVVEGGAGGLLDPRLASGVNVIDGVRRRISDNWPLVVVECGVACDATLGDNRIAHLLPGEAIIVRALHMNQRTLAGVVIGDVHMLAV